MQNQQKHSMRCFNAIVELSGGRRELAKKMGLTLRTVNEWAYRKKVPTNHLLKLVKLGQGKFSAEELLGKFDSVDDGGDS